MQEEECLWEKKMVSLFGNAEFEMPVEHLNIAVLLAASYVYV